MFEVIWSKWSDAYIVRSVAVQSAITPQFIGTREECIVWISSNK